MGKRATRRPTLGREACPAARHHELSNGTSQPLRSEDQESPLRVADTPALAASLSWCLPGLKSNAIAYNTESAVLISKLRLAWACLKAASTSAGSPPLAKINPR